MKLPLLFYSEQSTVGFTGGFNGEAVKLPDNENEKELKYQ